MHNNLELEYYVATGECSVRLILKMGRFDEREWLELLNHRDNEILRLSNDVAELATTVEELEGQLLEKNQYISDLEESISLLDEQFQLQTVVHRQQRDKYEGKIHELEVAHRISLQKLEGQHDSELQEMKAKIKALNIQLQQKDEELHHFEELVNNLDSQILDLKLQMSSPADDPVVVQSVQMNMLQDPESSPIFSDDDNGDNVRDLTPSRNRSREDDCGSPVQVRINRDLSRSHNYREKMYPPLPPPSFSLPTKPVTTIAYHTIPVEPKSTINSLEDCGVNAKTNQISWKDQKKHQYLFTEVDLFIDDDDHSTTILPPPAPPAAKITRSKKR